MKKTTVLLSCVFMLSFTTSVFADPIGKLKEGTMGIVKSPLHVFDHTLAEMDKTSVKPLGFLGGLLKGTFYMGKDVVKGAGDIVTFPIDK